MVIIEALKENIDSIQFLNPKDFTQKKVLEMAVHSNLIFEILKAVPMKQLE